jgi:hypothetical protein
MLGIPNVHRTDVGSQARRARPIRAAAMLAGACLLWVILDLDSGLYPQAHFRFGLKADVGSL